MGNIYEVGDNIHYEDTETQPDKELPVINNLDHLLKEIHKRGGIKLENCNEVNVIQHSIWENIKDEKVRDANLLFFNMILNYANMFIIAYNENKTMDEKVGIPE